MHTRRRAVLEGHAELAAPRALPSARWTSQSGRAIPRAPKNAVTFAARSRRESGAALRPERIVSRGHLRAHLVEAEPGARGSRPSPSTRGGTRTWAPTGPPARSLAKSTASSTVSTGGRFPLGLAAPRGSPVDAGGARRPAWAPPREPRRVPAPDGRLRHRGSSPRSLLDSLAHACSTEPSASPSRAPRGPPLSSPRARRRGRAPAARDGRRLASPTGPTSSRLVGFSSWPVDPTEGSPRPLPQRHAGGRTRARTSEGRSGPGRPRHRPRRERDSGWRRRDPARAESRPPAVPARRAPFRPVPGPAVVAARALDGRAAGSRVRAGKRSSS